MQDLVTRLAFKEPVEKKNILLDRCYSSQHIKIAESLVSINSWSHSQMCLVSFSNTATFFFNPTALIVT